MLLEVAVEHGRVQKQGRQLRGHGVVGLSVEMVRLVCQSHTNPLVCST